MRGLLERLFRLRENGTDLRTELTGGVTTFMTMAYIIFVQPVILGAAGMDPGAVMVATCVSSALATFLMAFWANYPIALAPGMGENVFFAYTVVVAQGYSWQQALGAIFVSGVLFILLSTVGLREKIVDSLPASLKFAISVGIGLLISVVGLEWAGIIVERPGTLIGMGDLTSAPVLLSLCGLFVMASLLALGVSAAVLVGMLVTLLLGLVTGMVQYEGVVSAVPSLAPILLKLDLGGMFQPEMLSIIFVFFFLALFDTVGTLTGITQEAGFIRDDGTVPRAREALLSDAVGTTAGALLGTSTVTCYIESATGVNAGARTGLANVVTGALFLLALFFSPLISMVGGGIPDEGGSRLYPVVAPALILVGAILIRAVRHIPWDDFSEGIPAFLTLVIMPLTFSITEGIAFGFISYTLLQLVSGRIRTVPPLVAVFSALFLLRYAFIG